MIIPITVVILGLEGAARLYVAKKYGSQTHGMNWKFMYEPYILTRTDDRLHDAIPPKGEAFRLLVIGGSTANLMPPEVLEKAFEPVVGRDVEVINFAQGGYIMNQERITLLLHGMRVKPDLLLTLNGANDIVTTSKTLRPGIAYANDFVALGVNQPVFNGLLGLVRNSQFVNCVNKLRERSVEGKAQGNDELLSQTLDHCEEALTTMAQIAKGMDIPHLMVLQPYIHLRANLSGEEKAVADAFAYRGEYMSKGFRKLRTRLNKTQWPGDVHFVDATKAFDDISDACFIDEVHLTEAGNEAMIRFIANHAATGLSLNPKSQSRPSSTKTTASVQ